jgi:hypothetical protein
MALLLLHIRVTGDSAHMERTGRAVDDEDRIEADVRVADEAPCVLDDEPSAEERLRDAYRLW